MENIRLGVTKHKTRQFEFRPHNLEIGTSDNEFALV